MHRDINHVVLKFLWSMTCLCMNGKRVNLGFTLHNKIHFKCSAVKRLSCTLLFMSFYFQSKIFALPKTPSCVYHCRFPTFIQPFEHQKHQSITNTSCGLCFPAVCNSPPAFEREFLPPFVKFKSFWQKEQVLHTKKYKNKNKTALSWWATI